MNEDNETLSVINKCINKGLNVGKILEIIFNYRDSYGKLENFINKEIDKIEN